MIRHPVTLAIDPGPTQSAWVIHNPFSDGIRAFGLWENDELLSLLRSAHPGGLSPDVETVVIEKIESFGMAVGKEVFETVFITGRFAEAAYPRRVDRIGRLAVKMALTHDSRAKDANIRAALIDRYGPGKEAAIGRKASPGPLFGVAGDVWSALAVACAWADAHR